MSRFHDLAQAQIKNELESSQQYLAIAVYFDSLTLPQLAGAFYKHAHEERNHALRFVQYLLDRRVSVEIPALDAVDGDFDSVDDALYLAVTHERLVTSQIENLAQAADNENDYLGRPFMDWFLKEQVEEETFVDKIFAAARSAENLLQLEAFVHREVDRKPTPGAPHIAGSGNV